MRIPSKYFVARSLVLLCAAFAITSQGTLRGQATPEPHAEAASAPAFSGPSAGLTNMYFTYPGIELWDASRWTAGKAKAAPLAQWITSHEKGTHADYEVKDKYKNITNFVGNPDYNWKTESITDPDVIAPLTRAGLRVDIREGGGLAIFVAPQKIMADKSHKVPMLLVPHVVDKMDVFWAMNTLVHFSRYNELCAQRGDFIIVYVIIEKAAVDRQSPLNNTAIETASDVYRGDYKRLYLDLSVFTENNLKVDDVSGLAWTDDAGKTVDIDARIEHLGFIPVLNVAGVWASKPSSGINITHPRTDIRYDPQRIIHGMIGEHWMEGIRFQYDHGKDNDPAIKAHFDEMGLVMGEHHTRGERWLFFSPKQAVEENKKLPLVLVLLETYDFNEYAVSTAYAEYLDYFKLAAEGDLNVLFFALESPDTMDLAYTIIKEAEKSYPIDPSRVYVTGHSHNGHLAREFAYRHPDMVAAAAPLGNSSGLAAPAYSHEAVVADDQRIQEWSKIDMPIVTIGAVSEVTSPHFTPSSILNDYNLFIEAWQRRLTASRCPMKSREEIMAAEHSDDYVTRAFGLPNDGSSLQMIDGVQHYIIDIKNVDGRKHLRIVGVDNMIHTPEPTMPMVGWTFMRRFARDQTTGKVIELY
jgi:hypothetical protein